MPLCNTEALTSIGKPCGNNAGGLRGPIYLIDRDAIVETGTTINVSAHTITNLEVTEAFTSYHVAKDAAQFTEKSAINLDGSVQSTYWIDTITINFPRRNAGAARSIELLAASQRYLFAMFIDRNGKYWAVDYLQLSDDQADSGKAFADGSKDMITLVGDNTYKAYEIDAALFASLTA